MSTDQTYTQNLQSPEATVQFGEKIGSLLKGGEVLDLSSDIGGGKTTMVRGIAKGFGSQDQVASPTFTISRRYSRPHSELEIHHFDFYRLNDPGHMKLELAESVDDPDVIVILEWSTIVESVLPKARCKISILAVSEDERKVTITCDYTHAYIIEGLQK